MLRIRRFYFAHAQSQIKKTWRKTLLRRVKMIRVLLTAIPVVNHILGEVNRKCGSFFVKKDTGKSALCKICNKEYAYHGGTSNLRDHLMRAHPSKLHFPQGQCSLDPYLSHSKCSDGRAKKITEYIVDMVVHDLRPAALVKGAGFKALMNYIEPGYRVPTATHIAEMVRQKFVIGKDNMKRYFQSEVHFMAVTTDIWTSRANDAYLSLTMHFVDSSWDMVSYVLATAPFPEHHTAVNIVDKVKQVMVEFNVESHRLLAIVHDQCANMQLAGALLCEESEGCQSLSCAAHRLQLCVEEGRSWSHTFDTVHSPLVSSGNAKK